MLPTVPNPTVLFGLPGISRDLEDDRVRRKGQVLRNELDAYVVLRVDAAADEDTIRTAYRTLARQYHPDGTDPDLALMTEINLAYDNLKTSERRERHDRRRRGLVAVGPGVPNAVAAPHRAALGGPLARRRAANALDEGPSIDFGRYSGWRIADVAQYDPDYLRWLSRHSTGIRYRAAIERCLPGEKDLGRRTAWIR